MVETAIDLFAIHGFDGVSTRTLAEAAGVNLPAIQYYFGSKEGLYRAAVNGIVQRVAEGMGPASARVAAALACPNLQRQQLLALLHEMLDAFLALIVDERRPEREKLFIVRAEIERGSALEPLHQTMRRYVLGPCAALVARLIDRPADDEETVARTLAIIGQILIFSHRKSRRLIGWGKYTEARIRMVQALLHEHTACILRVVGGAWS